MFDWDASSRAREPVGQPIVGRRVVFNLVGFGVAVVANASRIAYSTLSSRYDEKTPYIQVVKLIDAKWRQRSSKFAGTVTGDPFGATLAMTPDGTMVASGHMYGRTDDQVEVFDYSCKVEYY